MHTECCGCVNMRKGVMTIGIVGLVASFIGLIVQFVVLGHQQTIMKDHDDHLGNNLFSFIFIMGIVVCFFKCISDVLVIYGAVNQTTKEISVWLTVNLCTILYICITMVFMYTLLVAHESIFDHDTVLFFESLLLAVNVLYVYLWYQVYVFSRQLYLDGRTSLEGIIQSGYNNIANV